MAKNIITEVLDDMDQTPEATNVTFAVNGVSYEIDLSEKNSAKLTKALAPFVAVAREVKAESVKKSTAKNPEAGAMRAWAKEQGIAVPDRGRISQEVADQYRAAHTVAAS